MEVFKVFNSGFRISDSKQLISFFSEIINFTEEYVKFLIQRGKVYLRDNSSAYKTAVNITNNLFILENGYLVNFKRLFEGTSDSINTEDEFMKEMRSLLFPFIMEKLSSEYNHTNPFKSEFDECLKQMEAEGRILVTNIFTGKYIHRKPVDFSSAKCMKKGTLLYLLRIKNGTKHLTIESFLYFVFDLLESQTIYLHSLPYCQALQIYKLLMSEITTGITTVSNEIPN